ncbi:hypothetical protein Tco_0655315 [Tanacetum coccineum]|uniref:Uncharacterized protein n=1 Tax=Tanacetum coccineum TaxID=301880 RepID=A0ABQ4X5U0_9ASTR
MFNDNDFEELDDYIENVEEETVDVAATGVSTVSAPVSTAGVTISTVEPRTPPTTMIVFDDEDVTIAMAQTLIKMKEQKAKEKGGCLLQDVNKTSSRIARIDSDHELSCKTKTGRARKSTTIEERARLVSRDSISLNTTEQKKTSNTTKEQQNAGEDGGGGKERDRILSANNLCPFLNCVLFPLPSCILHGFLVLPLVLIKHLFCPGFEFSSNFLAKASLVSSSFVFLPFCLSWLCFFPNSANLFFLHEVL